MVNLKRKMISFEQTHIPAIPIIRIIVYMIGPTTFVVVYARIPPIDIIIQKTIISQYVILTPPPPIDHAFEYMTVNIINPRQNTINITSPH
jgi:hypothetical protein